MKQSELRTKLYHAEKEIISSLLNYKSIDNIISDGNLYLKINKNLEEDTIKSINEVLNLTLNINLTQDILSNFQRADMESAKNEINEEIFNESKFFVSNIFNCDLSLVNWTHLNNSVSVNSEASCWPCGDKEHHIFTYPNDEGIISTDLLIHEIGHAADFTIARGLNDDRLLIGHKSLKEGIAFYCQYLYLSKYGTENSRMVSIGGFLFTYLTILILRYCLKNKIKLEDINAREAITDPLFKEVIYSYNQFNQSEKYGEHFVLNKINDAKNRFITLSNLIFSEISPRLGVIIGLLLLEKPMEEIKELIHENTIETSLSIILNKYIPDYDESIKNTSNIFNKYIYS